jgi:UV excision repair protein RAD23
MLTNILGKILQDEKTVEDYKIEEKGFIVCMISKVCRISGNS